MTSCYPPPRMRWNAAIGAIARCKRASTGCGRKRRSVRVWRSICGVKRTPKAVNKPLHYFIVHELDKPGSSTTVSYCVCISWGSTCRTSKLDQELALNGSDVQQMTAQLRYGIVKKAHGDAIQ